MPNDQHPAETDLHSSLTENPPILGSGTLTQAVSPTSQVNAQRHFDSSLASKVKKKQQIHSVTPGQDVAGKPSIKGRTSFSDEMGD
jgi:hypothetical protein